MKKKAEHKKKVDIVAGDDTVEPGAATPTEETTVVEGTDVEVGERDFEMELEQKAVEYEELRDRHLRLVAEFDNFRKRTAREMGEAGVEGQAQLLSRLLDALDDLGRVADLDPEKTGAADVLAGVGLVERNILKELEEIGLETISETGVPFDPNHHEAIGTIPTPSEADDNTVARVLQLGYRFGPVLLRPARVQVFT